MSLLDDASFLPWVQKYADDKDLFYKDFANAFSKLLELGVERRVRSSFPFLSSVFLVGLGLIEFLSRYVGGECQVVECSTPMVRVATNL